MTTATTQTPNPANSTSERALATVETVTAIRDIPGADMIVCARIRGWDVVVKRDEFTVGDPCVYFEVDTMIEVADDRFAFLAARGVRSNGDDSYGHVLKTARLRGQYSQGLAMPLSQFPELHNAAVGDDVTDQVPVTKYDPPIPAELLGLVRGFRPTWISSTDEIRIQNLPDLLTSGAGLSWVATEKLDGTSTTYYVDPTDAGYRGACTRNLDLLHNNDSHIWQLAATHRVHDLLEDTFPNQRAVVQGEAYGFGIVGNPLRLPDKRFAAFNLIVDGVRIPREQWPHWLTALSVPTHDLTFPTTVDEALAQVETLKSKVAPDRAAEGVVWRAVEATDITLDCGRVETASTKVISNKYLMKNDR